MHCILAFRRGREAAFGREPFADPAWDLLLELYAASLGDRPIAKVSDLAKSIGMPQSNIGRWINVLAARKLVVSYGTVEPEQRAVELSPTGARQMKRLLDYWAKAFRSI